MKYYIVVKEKDDLEIILELDAETKRQAEVRANQLLRELEL